MKSSTGRQQTAPEGRLWNTENHQQRLSVEKVQVLLTQRYNLPIFRLRRARATVIVLNNAATESKSHTIHPEFQFFSTLKVSTKVSKNVSKKVLSFIQNDFLHNEKIFFDGIVFKVHLQIQYFRFMRFSERSEHSKSSQNMISIIWWFQRAWFSRKSSDQKKKLFSNSFFFLSEKTRSKLSWRKFGDLYCRKHSEIVSNRFS